jgi:hypothetical protein
VGQFSFACVFVREPYDDMAGMKGGYGSGKGGRNCSAYGLHLILPMSYAVGKGMMRMGNVICREVVTEVDVI